MAQIGHDDQAGVDAEARLKGGGEHDTAGGEAGIGGDHCVSRMQGGADGPLWIVFAGAGVAEIREDAVAEILADGPAAAFDRFAARFSEGEQDLAQIFGMEGCGHGG